MKMREFYLIKLAKEILKVDREDVLIGVGEDDCAVVKINGKYLVLTTDCVHEKTDFPKGIKDEEIGHLALAVTLSDLAGTGAKPLFFLYTITLTEDVDDVRFKRILRGMKKLADKYGVSIIGGDTDFGDELYISGFGIGVADRFVTQSGAKIGDKVCLTGPLGKAQLSLEQLMSGMERNEIAYPDSLFKPEPRVREGMELAKYANAMTDVSDSLAVSLHLIAEKSNVGIKIYEDKLRLEHLLNFVDYNKALELFLYSGGDYELVYTSNKCVYGFEIGEVIDGSGVWLIRKDGTKQRIEFRGYVHG